MAGTDRSQRKAGMHGEIEQAAERLAASERAVAFTGAGISAESGLGTFRDAGGLWSRFDPDEVAGAGGWLTFLIRKPVEGVEFLRELRDSLAAARPNPAHLALAELERDGRLRAVITQNVDGLHREAGSGNVIEVHGSFFRRRCMDCGRTENLSRQGFFSELEAMIGKLASCLVTHPAHLLVRCECGGLFRTDFVAFGEPVQQLAAALEEVRQADVLLVCGTSGLVYPAAALPDEAKERGAYLVEVNPEPSELSPLADLRIGARAAEALPQLVRRVRRLAAAV